MERIYAVDTITDNGSIVVGESRSFTEDKELWVVRFDSNGNIIWEKLLMGVMIPNGYFPNS